PVHVGVTNTTAGTARAIPEGGSVAHPAPGSLRLQVGGADPRVLDGAEQRGQPGVLLRVADLRQIPAGAVALTAGARGLPGAGNAPQQDAAAIGAERGAGDAARRGVRLRGACAR